MENKQRNVHVHTVYYSGFLHRILRKTCFEHYPDILRNFVRMRQPSLWSTDHFPLRGYTILRKHPPESGLCDRLGSSCVSAPCIPAQPLIA